MRKAQEVCGTGLALLLAGACAIDFPTIKRDGADDDDDAGTMPDDDGMTTPPPPGEDCGNGVIDAGEKCDGDDLGGATCASEGLGDGPVACTASCQLDTSACVAPDGDLDGDGLSGEEEATLGTDPANADSDGDGFDDGAEVDASTDPLNLGSWPQGTGAWPDRSAAATADGVSGGGSMSTGGVAPNLSLTDQNGNAVHLHQFYGYVTVLAIGAEWCGPCQQAASTSEELWAEHREDGVIFIELLAENNSGGPPNQSVLQGWASDFGLSYPVTTGNPQASIGAYPTFIFIGKDLVVDDITEGFPGDAAVSSEIDQLVAQ
jgi:hypothetical protein